jgi:FKBP-type peptidyl-prolyl cis-trans isomerase FkpA
MKVLSCVVMSLALLVSGCGGSDSSPTAPSANVPFSITELRAGTGAEATAGRTATVNYSLWIWDRLGADNKGSRLEAGTFTFAIGGNVIQGFSQGTLGMRVGGLRRVVVPPNLGYGDNPPPGSGIRPNETLIFEIELLAVQ